MIAEELRVKITVDTSGLKQSVNQIKQTMKGLNDSTNGTSKTTKQTSAEVDKLKDAIDGLKNITGISVVVKSFTGLRTVVTDSVRDFKMAADEFMGAFNFKNFDVGDDGLKGYLQSMIIQFKEAGKTIKGTFVASLKVAGVAVASIAASIAGLIAVFNKATEASREFREAMNRINTSFISLGSTAETAQQAFNGFYRVLGEVDRSAEAANLLAQITTNQKELAQWTNIATGALAMFPDSLPTEGLIEAANETIKTSQVVGVLADALNWPANSANKISEALKGSTEAQKIFNDALADGMTVEDAFNKVLAATNSETQREVILRASLNNIYRDSAALYEEMNKDIIAQNEAQNRLNQALAKVGAITQPLTTAFTNLKAVLLNALAPAIQVIVSWLTKFVEVLTTVITWIGAFISVVFPGAMDSVSASIGGVSSSIGGVTDSIGSATGGVGDLTGGLEDATTAAEQLRRSVMGFDELNVLPSQNTGSSGGSGGSGSGGGTGAGSGGGIDISGIDTGESIFAKAQEQMEEFKTKIQDFFDKWKTQIQIIAGALGALGIATLLGHLGEAIGLGEKFLTMMNTIKKLATTAIVITLQYSLVNEFMDAYIDGEGFKNYLLGILTAAIGTGILYSMWGPAGLVIGLGVTAVASLKAVFDNGGITNVESAVVALTGLASAIGAVVAAVKLLGPAIAASNFGAFIALLKEGNGLVPTLSAAFPGLSNAITTVINVIKNIPGAITGAFSVVTGAVSSAASAFTGLAGSIGSAIGLTGSAAVAAGAAIIVAAIAAVVSVVVFLKENWDAVTTAVKNFFNENIVPKLDAIRECWEKIKTALSDAAEAFLNAIPEPFKEALEFIGNKIGEIIQAIADWFAQLDLLEAIGQAFEVIGGIIFSVLSGVVLGAINGVVNAIKGLAEMVTGVVEIISGAIQIIVGLFTGDLDAARKGVETITTGIKDLFQGLYDSTIGIVIEFVKGIISWFTNLWDELVGHSIVPDMINDIVDWFLSLPTKILEPIQKFCSDVLAKFQNLWSNIKNWFNSNVAKIFTKDYWLNKFNAIKDGASAKLEEVKTTIQNMWNNIKNWFSSNVAPKFTVSYWSNKFSVIKDGAKSALNGLIGIVEKAINWIITKLNKLSWSIPSWVPGVGGKKFGFSMSTISIPRLATGGIAMSSTLANIGENGREAILPLDNNTSWMDTLADKIAARNGGPSKIVLKVGEREIGWAAINGINQVTKQTGGLQLQLV